MGLPLSRRPLLHVPEPLHRAATVPALEAAPAFRDVRLLSAVRTGATDGPERFEIEMRLGERVTAREGASP